MIYCIDPSLFPTDPKKIVEQISYRDENDFEWRIVRIKNGFMVRFFGDDYFKESKFFCELKSGKTVVIKNTNCIFFDSNDFDLFCDIRDLLKNENTDDIWDFFNEMLTERFEHSDGILESEMLDAKKP